MFMQQPVRAFKMQFDIADPNSIVDSNFRMKKIWTLVMIQITGIQYEYGIAICCNQLVLVVIPEFPNMLQHPLCHSPQNFLQKSQGLQSLHHPANRQSHHIVKVSFNSPNANDPNPFLNGISTCFVVGLILIDIKFNLLLRE